MKVRAQDEPRLGPADFIADIKSLTEIVTSEWSYLGHRRELDGVDLAKLEARALEELENDPDARRFLGALTRYVAGLHDGHADVVWDQANRMEPRRLPIALADAAEGVIITGVAKDVRGADSLEAGDVVLAIDGVPIERAIAQAEQLVFASTPGARRQLALRALVAGTARELVRIEVEQFRTGERVTVESDCPPVHLRIDAPALPLTQRDSRVLEDGIGYFRPGSFRPPRDAGWSGASPDERERILENSYAELRRIIDELSATRVLILDLRGNTGGTDLLGQELAGLLLDRSATYFQLQGRDESGRWRGPHSYRVRPARGRDPYAGAIICLIDEGTFSTADNLAACLRDEHPRITFVGRPTNAGTGAPRPFTLPRSGAQVWLCTQRVYSPSGKFIEGIGVSPDILVRPTRDQILANKDADLEVALKLAREAVRRAPVPHGG